MSDQWDGLERRRWVPRLNVLGPYIAMVLMVIVGFFVQGENSSRIEREAKQRDHAICEDGNERGKALREYTAELGQEVPGIPKAVAEQLAAIAAKKFAPKECPPAP